MTNGPGKWFNIVQISVQSTKFGRGIEVNTLSNFGYDVKLKLNTSSFLVMELIFYNDKKSVLKLKNGSEIYKSDKV